MIGNASADLRPLLGITVAKEAETKEGSPEKKKAPPASAMIGGLKMLMKKVSTFTHVLLTTYSPCSWCLLCCCVVELTAWRCSLNCSGDVDGDLHFGLRVQGNLLKDPPAACVWIP